MPEPFEHCLALVRAHDKDRFLAALFAPARHRRALHALYAFDVETARIRERAREPMPGELRLQWWRDAIGGVVGEAIGHPVVAALREVIVRYGLSPAALVALIDARSFDLYDEPMASLGQFQAYANQTAAIVFQAAVRILCGGTGDGLPQLAEDAGQAAAIAEVLAALPRHAARRQLYVPLDLLAQYGAGAEDVFAGRATVELRAALAAMRLRARRHLARLAASGARVPQPAIAAFLPLAPVAPWLRRMERRSYDPFRPPQLPQWRRQWRIWRVAHSLARLAP